MPKVKDAKDKEFLKEVDDDIKSLNIDAEGSGNEDEEGGDGTDNDPVVRLRDGIDTEHLKQGHGATFEVMSERPAPVDTHYFEEQKYYTEMHQLAEQGKTHWDPEVNEEDAEYFYQDDGFAKKAEGMEDVTEAKDGGVMKEILQHGQGQVVPKDALVRIHYNAFHEKSTKPFDSSRLRGQEQRFQLGQGDVILGMDLAVSTMKLNELSCFLVKPEYAYGDLGCGPRIPGNSTILYEIELLNFISAADGADKFFAMTKREKDSVPFKQILKYVRSDKDAASDYFRRDLFRDAISRYLRSIKVLEEMKLADADEEGDQQNLLRILYLNVAQCFLNISKPNRTVTYARKALYLKANDVKALFKLGKAFRLLGDFEKARKILNRARAEKPMNKDIGQELEELEIAMRKCNDLEREQCRRMFSGGSIVDSVSNHSIRNNNNGTNTTSHKAKKVDDVDDDFRNSVNKRLDDFIKDKDLIEIMAGNGARLADYELGYIIETAQAKGLLYRLRKGEMYLLKSPEMIENSTRANSSNGSSS